jgi:starch synthase (maltosyl-transferring)
MPEKQKTDQPAGPRLGAIRPNRSRAVIEGVEPQIDGGRFPIKRTVGDEVVVEADVFIDGHEALSCALLHRRKGATRWTETLMAPLDNDRWISSFTAAELGRYEYTVVAWHDPFKGWRRDLEKRIEADQDISVDLAIGADLVDSAAERAQKNDRKTLEIAAAKLREATAESQLVALDDALASALTQYAKRETQTEYAHVLEVVVDPVRARFSTWYELFPRSAADGVRHGTFADVEKWLPHIAALGFDVLYFPPIHPIGTTYRKGRNNSLTPDPDDVGSPWAIGAADGGHKAIHSELGTLEDFRKLLAAAQQLGIDIALDIAFQAAPDHPYVREHEGWFRKRPDGTIQYAENPPKKYQDIYPFDFDTDDIRGLWGELRSVFEFWAQQGVRVFRVDNPHTKPFPFWEWCIGSLKAAYPDMIFLSEAFTRPKIMYRLAKLGFSQSYTYFAWRTQRQELTEYFTELTTTDVREFFRPNLWPNTPDILTEQFHTGGQGVFMQRAALAATLGASYGIYGPAFEHLEHLPREAGSEEYLHSEKYQLRAWQPNAANPVSAYLMKLNQARRAHPALQRDDTLRFHSIENQNIIAYSKTAPPDDIILTVVNLDPTWTQAGWVHLPLEDFGIETDEEFTVHDLLTEDTYTWRGEWNYVELNPETRPAHVFAVNRPRTRDRERTRP